MKKFLSLVVILLVGVCLWADCSKQSPLVGKWSSNVKDGNLSGVSEIEFFEDGKFKFSFTVYNHSDKWVQGTWCDLGNGKLQLIGAIDSKFYLFSGNDDGTISYEIKGRELLTDGWKYKWLVYTKQ